MKVILFAIVVHLVSGFGQIEKDAGTSVKAPAPAIAASPGPAVPGLEALHVSFEIENFNYYDLTKVTCPKKVKVKVPKKNGGKAPKNGKTVTSPGDDLAGGIDANANMDKAMKDIHGHTDDIEDRVKDVKVHKDAPQLPFFAKAKEKKVKDAQGKVINEPTLLQVGACAKMPDLTETKSKECTTIMDVLRTAIEETVRGILACMYQESLVKPFGLGPAPAPVALPVGLLPGAPAGVSGLVPLPPQPQLVAVPFGSAAGFLQASAPAPASVGGQAPVMEALEAETPDKAVKIFVTFSPGKEMQGGRSTMVDIAFLDSPNNGVDDVLLVTPFIEVSVKRGLFKEQMNKALKRVTGIKPKLKKVTHGMKVIMPFDVQKCEKHIKSIVGQFSLHYTREQVPRALFNECTNFMTKISFSHDHVLDPMDTMRCRKATAKFTKHWGYGNNTTESDFEDMCHKACEAKYGNGAPTCNLLSGDQLMNQPVF